MHRPSASLNKNIVLQAAQNRKEQTCFRRRFWARCEFDFIGLPSSSVHTVPEPHEALPLHLVIGQCVEYACIHCCSACLLRGFQKERKCIAFCATLFFEAPESLDCQSSQRGSHGCPRSGLSTENSLEAGCPVPLGHVLPFLRTVFDSQSWGDVMLSRRNALT